MRHARTAALWMCVATAATAADTGTPLTGDEFERAVTGRTLYFNSAGQPYGVEQYLPDRKVVWAFVGDDCRKGRWYDENGLICFVYDDNPDPQCWLFFTITGGLAAQSVNYPDSPPLTAVEQSPEPIACLGPNVGV
ncbi:MAG: hypothetical protein R3D97_00490 [Paracoccaceae bacterium]